MRAERQTMVLLSISMSCMEQLLSIRAFSALYMREYVQTTKEALEKVIIDWPTFSISVREKDKILMVCGTWENYTSIICEDFYTLPVLSYISQMCVLDLLDKLKNKQKRKVLEDILPMLEKIINFFDPHGANTVALDKANQSIKYLHKLIEW